MDTGILECRRFCDSGSASAQVAVFDTAFHATIPRKAYLYALPLHLYTDLAVRRYGFHGTSYTYLLAKSAEVCR